MMILPKNCTAKEWLEQMDKLVNYECPQVGESFWDIENRKLLVNKVDIKNCLDRQVQGTIFISKIYHEPSFSEQDYSCTLDTWAAIWRDKLPRADAAKMVC
jgi:predicted RNA-binding Zn-ribbon protein involved in translation (DUF1610 family)